MIREKNISFSDVMWEQLSMASLPVTVLPWLSDAGSFMERMRKKDILAEVNVLQEGWQIPEKNETALVGENEYAAAWIREVLITTGASRWMFARSVFPKHILTGEQIALTHLKSQSLGSILFKDTRWQRSAFEVVALRDNMPIYHDLKVRCDLEDNEHLADAELWARRSTFTLENKVLLLVEVFLPDIFLL